MHYLTPSTLINISELPFSLSSNLHRSIHKILSLNLNTLSVSSTASLLSAVECENTTKSMRILALHHGFAGHPVMSMSNVEVTNHRRGLTWKMYKCIAVWVETWPDNINQYQSTAPIMWCCLCLAIKTPKDHTMELHIFSIWSTKSSLGGLCTRWYCTP